MHSVVKPKLKFASLARTCNVLYTKSALRAHLQLPRPKPASCAHLQFTLPKVCVLRTPATY